LAGICFSVSILIVTPAGWTSEGVRFFTRILDGIYVHRWRDGSSLDPSPAMPEAIRATEYHNLGPGSNDSKPGQSMFTLTRATESFVHMLRKRGLRH
jgi:hypothetical protein